LDAVTLLGPKRVISLIVSSATIAAQSQLLKN
jgi:HD-like signal output (HDOD) protein